MSCAVALTFLYEVLVAESRYEVRGSVYRSRIKSLYEEMLHSLALYSYDPVKRVRQSIHKCADDLVATVGLVDISSGKSAHQLVCPGIRQYLVPNIPDFCDLNEEFIETWRKFFGTGPIVVTNVTRTKRRRPLEGGSKAGGEGDANADSTTKGIAGVDADAVNPGFVPILTEQDILVPRQRPKVLDAVFEESQEDEHLTHDPKEIVWEFPLAVNQNLDIGNECIVFGLMGDSELECDWASNCSFTEFCKRIYSDVNFELGAEESTECEPVYEDGTEQVHNLVLNHDHDHEHEHEHANDRGPEEANNVIMEMVLDADATASPVPKNIANSPEEMNIFGNYYLPLKRLNVNVESEASMVDGYDDAVTTSASAGASPSPLDGASVAPVSASVSGDSMELVNCTLGDLQVKSTYFYGPMGVAKVKCEATLLQGNTSKSPGRNINLGPDTNGDDSEGMENNMDSFGFFVGGFKVDACMPSMDPKDLLAECLSDLYASRDQLRGTCLLCKGWNVLDGCAITFCEYCEARIFTSIGNLHPMVRIFDLRRQLVSSLYQRVGYKIPLISKEPAKFLERMAADELPPSDVNIYSLCELGGIFPKATLHDSRLMPNCYNVPTAMSKDVYNLLYSPPQLPDVLLDICREKRSQRARLFNTYLAKIYKLYHSRPANSRPPQLVALYNGVFKNGTMPQSNSGMGFFDTITSYILTRLPLDSDLLSRCFYHRGIYADVPQGIGLWETLALELNFADDLHAPEDGESGAPADFTMELPSNSKFTSAAFEEEISDHENENEQDHGPLDNKERDPEQDQDQDRVDDVDVDVGDEDQDQDQDQEQDEDEDDYQSSSGDASVDENPNGWRLLWLRHQNKINAAMENHPDASSPLASAGASPSTPSFPSSAAANNQCSSASVNPQLKPIMDVLKYTGFLDNAPPHVMESLMQESKIYIGYPTTLEMHVMQIPNAVLDPSLFGHAGKAIVYSLPALIQNFVALSPVMKVGTRNLRRKKTVPGAGTATTPTGAMPAS